MKLGIIMSIFGLVIIIVIICSKILTEIKRDKTIGVQVASGWTEEQMNSVKNRILIFLNDPDLKLSKTIINNLSSCIVNKFAMLFPYDSVSESLNTVYNGGRLNPEMWDAYITCLQENWKELSDNFKCPSKIDFELYDGYRNFATIIRHIDSDCLNQKDAS